MRPRRLQANKRFTELLDAAAANAADAGAAMLDLLRAFPATGPDRERLHACERGGDELLHELSRLITATYVTPFDREDIFALASALDDVVDHLEEAADQIQLYGVKRIPPEALRQGEVATAASSTLAAAVHALCSGGAPAPLLVEVHAHENEGDAVVRQALAALFEEGTDPLVVIRWKDIYEQVEQAIDACERAATVIETILLKNR